MRLARFRFLIVPLFLVFACVAAIAQQNSEIVGTITDQTGAAVPGATLTLTQTETGTVKNGVSNSTGGFVFAGLNVGTYTLKVTAKGFESATTSNLVLNVSQTLAADTKLTVGAETQEVSVTADALQVQAESNTVSTLISGEQVTEIATENRNFSALATLGLGVSSNLPDSNTPTSVASSASFSVNGLRQSHNIWLIDGGEADDRGGAGGMDVMPSMDAIAQFEVLASNYPPDYGISSGATMSLALKSGTQKFHGELFEFNRNDAFDANNFFNKYNGANSPVPKLRQNIFGGNLGGPLFIPHVFNTSKQKTFFFYNQEFRRIIQGSQPNVQNTIPDADRPVAGTDLHYVAPSYATGATVYVPDSHGSVTDPAYVALLTSLNLVPNQPFPNQVIPHQLFDANAVTYLGLGIIPKSSQTGKDISVSSLANPITVSEEIVRVDHNINSKWQILGHYIHDSVSQGYPDADLGWNWETYNTISSTLSNPANSAAIKMSGTISPNLLLEASFNYDGNIINIVNSSAASKPSGWTATQLFNNGSPNLPGVNVNGTTSASEQTGYGTWHNAAEDYEPKVDLSYTRGKHAMKFGFSYNRYTKNQQLQADPGGDYGFSQNQTNHKCFVGDTDTNCSAKNDANGDTVQGDGWASLILGLAGSYSQAEHLPIRHYVNQTTSAYLNDNWKVSPRLSLQLGLRYDALPHAWERNNALANFDPASYIDVPGSYNSDGSINTGNNQAFWNPDGSINPAAPGVSIPVGLTLPFYMNGMQIPGQAGYPHGLVTNDYNTTQPRIGFSYDVTGAGKTVLRGGFGTFYERLQGNDIYGVANGNTPYQYTPNLSNVYFSNPFCSFSTPASDCLSSTTLPILPAGLTSIAKTYKAPGVAQYSLGVQHELAPSVILVVQYVGNVAWHQNIDRPINNYPLNTPYNLRKESAQGGLPGTLYGNSNALRTYQGYGGITQEENTTNGTYNGFQTGLRLQNKWGLSGELDYTYSHEIDLTSGDLATISNPYNLKYDKAGGSYDRRQILQANYIYRLPIFNKTTGFLHSTLGGWELAGTFIDETGVPVAAGMTNYTDTIGLGGGYSNRPDVIAKPHYSHKGVVQVPTTNKGAEYLAIPTPGYAGGANLGFGNSKRDTFVGPGRVDFTTSLYKSFAIAERAHIDLRIESYNTFNHTQFSNLDATLNDGNFGQSTGTWDPRVLQLGGKFVF